MSMTKRGVTSAIVMNVIERRRKTHSSLDITDSRGRDGNELQYQLITCKNNALSAHAHSICQEICASDSFRYSRQACACALRVTPPDVLFCFSIWTLVNECDSIEQLLQLASLSYLRRLFRELHSPVITPGSIARFPEDGR